MMNGVSTTMFAPALADYSRFVKLQNGDVYCWGQGCRDPKTNACVGIVERDEHQNVIRYDIGAQCAQVLTNLEGLYFAAGVKKEQVRDVYVFVTNMNDAREIYDTVHTFFSSVDTSKLRIQIVGSLPLENFVEIKSIATTNPSGQIAEIEPLFFDVDVELMDRDFKLQAVDLYQQLDNILAERRLGKEHVIDGTLLVKDRSNYDLSNDAWNSWISTCQVKPARTTVFVPGEKNAIRLRAVITDIARVTT